jgi:sortase (surface protein transpeptidase)
VQALAAILAGAAAGYAYSASRDDGAPHRAAADRPVVQGRAESPPRRRRVDHRPDPAPRVAPGPPRIEIPSIKVRAHAIALGKTPDNRLEVPTNWSEVGWWSGGPVPGDRGPAVVVGHVDSKAGPAVFYRLRELRSGAIVKFVRPDRTTARFVVERSASYSKSSFPTAAVYGPTRDRELRLVTCGGSFDWSTGHYRDNLVVFARAA